jgi:diphosphomevalonate decarboxylase
MTDLFTAWECPSNIALIKYWGKKPGQIPCNPSLSLTLKNAHTRTRIHAQPQQSRFPNVQVRFNGQESVQLATKITGWLQLIIYRD